MRIVAGKFRGRKLTDSSHLKDLRPTTDKNREALFNILFSAKFIREMNFEINGTTVLDLCCGTGAVAFEALSRGASQALLVDKNSAHLEVAKKNAQIFGVENAVKFLLADAEKLPQSSQIYNFIYIDPPYAYNASQLVQNLVEKNWADKNSLIVIEAGKDVVTVEGLRLLDSRQYGITRFSFYSL